MTIPPSANTFGIEDLMPVAPDRTVDQPAFALEFCLDVARGSTAVTAMCREALWDARPPTREALRIAVVDDDDVLLRSQARV